MLTSDVLCCIDEMSDLKGDIKLLEEKNMSFMQQNLDLEEVETPSAFLRYIMCGIYVRTLLGNVHIMSVSKDLQVKASVMKHFVISGTRN